MTLNIVSPGPLTTVQDFGRFGHQAEGYPECGACDKYALALANLLCGNGECPHMAGLEYTLAGPTLRADDYTLVALTGGAVEPKVNGKRVNMFEPLLLAPGDTLEIGMLVSGLRGYLAVFGGFDIHPVLGSRSTDLKCHIGGLNGRALKAGDVLPVLRAFELPQERFRPLQKRVRAAALEDWALTTLTPHGFIGAQKFPLLRVVLGPQDEMFTEKGLFDFKSALYTVTQDSNRMAAKLNGAAIEARAGVDILSDGIVEGSVQISANGQPIVMLTDHQSTGGYAKIATVIPCDIPTLAQVRPGQLVGFRVVTVEEGTAACKKEKDKWAYLKEKIDHDGLFIRQPESCARTHSRRQNRHADHRHVRRLCAGQPRRASQRTGVGFSAVLPAQPEVLSAAGSRGRGQPHLSHLRRRERHCARHSEIPRL